MFTTAAVGANSFTQTITVAVGATNEHVAVFSVYDVTNGYVALTLASTVAPSAIGAAFSSFFPGYTESDFASALETSNTANTNYLLSFFTTNLSDFPTVTNNNATGTIITFSNGAAGGSVSVVTSVPEPGSCALLSLAGAGALGLGAFVRRRAV